MPRPSPLEKDLKKIEKLKRIKHSRAEELEALDPAGRRVLDEQRQKRSEKSMNILETMFLAGEPFQILDITCATDYPYQYVVSTLRQLSKQDLIESVGRGIYQRSSRTYEPNFGL